MKQCIIIGKPNVGKTSFFLSFAEYLGIHYCTIEIIDYNGNVIEKNFSVDFARKSLVSSSAYKTRHIYKIKLTVPVYKGYEELVLLDTAGLTDGISEIAEVRQSMALTLQELNRSKIILHMLDTYHISLKKDYSFSHIDMQINQFGKQQGAYCIIANKMDKEGSRNGLSLIQSKFDGSYIIPVSALYQIGFREVKSFVARNI